jgi:hypothetical protein
VGRIAGPADRVAVLIRGDDNAATAQAEVVLLRSVAANAGLRALDAEGLSMLRRDEAAVAAAAAGDFAPLASLGRERGVEVMVVGNLTSRAVAAANQTYTGFAELRARMYRVSAGSLGDEVTFVTSPQTTTAAPAFSEEAARVRAAQDAATRAAAAVNAWLARPAP